MSKSGRDIRSEFIKFFEDRGHRAVPGSSLLPADDPTLLFTNAGMNQFKPIFLGTETRDYTRAVNTQKCIRAGGKHNDLEDVGRDCYHHTFFEMLGNWSFGDYFKRDAIDWAWTLLTDVWGLDEERLYATYFEGCPKDGLAADIEARELWLQYLPANRVLPGNEKDNFWEMGETGPCGPCSEVHYDLTEDKSGGPLVNAGHPSVIEIWNLVFIQFNRDKTGVLTPLPARHVDTGMGFERITAVIQGKKSNYATDLFIPIIEHIETMTPHKYGWRDDMPEGFDRFDVMDESNLGDVAMRVIADHARALTFAIADGILPSNDGRGSVLRAILRRAAGFGRQHLGIEDTFLYKFVPTIVDMFRGTFDELASRKYDIIDIIRNEEDAFGKTLSRGLDLFNRQAERIKAVGDNQITGEISFQLHATYGFPFSLTKLMAEKVGLAVDEDSHIELMEEHRAASGGGRKFKAEAIVGLPKTDDSAKFDLWFADGIVLGWVVDGGFIDEGELTEGSEAAVVLDMTCLYGESGGQIGDEGWLIGNNGKGVEFRVETTQLAGQCVLHFGRLLKGTLRVGQTVRAEVSPSRMDIMRNHTATHLLNWALRDVLGDGVNQAGSVVDASRLRFDFTCNTAVTPQELAEVERRVNQFILEDTPITPRVMPLSKAKNISGVRAIFGEKYPDPVRVVTIGDCQEDCAVEFCGGTHVALTSQIGLFKIISEESVAKGIRRITAITGAHVADWITHADATLKTAATALKISPSDIPERVGAMQAEIKKLKKRPAGGASDIADAVTLETPAGKVLVARAGVADAGIMRNICDQQRQKGAVAILLGAADDSKVMLVAMVSDELSGAGKFHAGDWVKATAPIVGGGGGGKPSLAQAGGKQPEKLPEALKAAEEFARQQLG
ncbi:MAG: alanine--tRNA ligase [Phycisphaerae bacterium]|nr:alanine--tRNA ligase [Phycisphaerae bacterium]